MTLASTAPPSAVTGNQGRPVIVRIFKCLPVTLSRRGYATANNAVGKTPDDAAPEHLTIRRNSACAGPLRAGIRFVQAFLDRGDDLSGPQRLAQAFHRAELGRHAQEV